MRELFAQFRLPTCPESALRFIRLEQDSLSSPGRQLNSGIGARIAHHYLVEQATQFLGLARLVRALSSRGFETCEAGDGASAVAQARRSNPQRAIVDLRMPGRSGIELISDLIELDPSMQIVVLTGYGSIATAVEAVRRGAIDYLSKPVDTEQILGERPQPQWRCCRNP